MTMTKIMPLAILAAVAAGVGSARADYYLRWQVEDSNDIAFDKAAVKVTGDNGYSALLADADALSRSLGTFYYLDAEEGGRSTVETQGWFAPENSGNYVFQIQLFDDKDELIGASSVASMAMLGSEGLRALSSTPMSPADAVWKVSTFTNVPEPTSGMLFLLGLASLALRRRRV